MRGRIYIVVFTFLVGLFFVINRSQKNSVEGTTGKEKVGKLSKFERIQGMFEHEFNKTVDPNLGSVPKRRLFDAKAHIQKLSSLKKNPFEVNWEERGPNMVGGRTRGMIFDLNDPTGSTVWAGGVGGGLWKNTNIRSQTNQWTLISDDFTNIAITSIVQNPLNPDVMFFGTGEAFTNSDAIQGMGIWRSTDGGVTWEPSEGAEQIGFEFVFKMLSDAEGNIYAATKKGLFVTDDDGITWRYILGENRSAESNDVVDVEVAADGTIFATVGLSDGDGIYRRLPGQNSFVKLDFDVEQSNYRRLEVAIAPTDLNRVYLLVSGSGGECRYIFRSQDKGGSWTELSVPSAIGMNNFARDQAWYDLEIAVDPMNEDRVFIGGIDLLLSEDGGNNWQQISQWFGRNFQFVHADQHRIVFSPQNPREALFGNDGGVYYCSNIGVSQPGIEARIFGYNVTQYYAGAMHPTDDNFFIGGTQDNGTHAFDQAGINPGLRLTGGDGAFCHIDQDNPNVMITSYVYSSYYFSNNKGQDFRNVNFGGRTGLFINPTEYDSETNTFFANYRSGNYLKVNNVDILNSFEDVIPVPEFDRASIQSLKASPNIFDRIYFGLTNGRVVYVDNASSQRDTAHAVEISPQLVSRGFLSSIDVAEGDEDHILVTFSNYGVESVWETTDGGTNWNNIEGNLPDFPVRWGMFAPDNDGLILLATEMGVWTTANAQGDQTEWTPSDESLANTRIDMLKKNKNGTVMAATHGRGIFTTNSFKDLSVSFLDSFSVHFNSRYRLDGCSLNQDTIRIPVVINRRPEDAIEVLIAGTDDFPASVQLISDRITFDPNERATKKFVEIIIDQDDFLGENIRLNFSLSSSSDYSLGDITSYSLEIVDDLSQDVSFLVYSLDSSTTEISLIREKTYGNRLQIIYSVEELQQAGLAAGEIGGIQLYSSSEDQSSRGVQMTMYIGKASFDNAPFGFPYQSGLGDPVFEGNYVFEKGSNTFIFEEPYVWDGNSNLAIQFCFTDTWDTGEIQLIANIKDKNMMIDRVSRDDRIDPCSFFTASDYYEIQPIVGFIGFPRIADSSAIEKVIDKRDNTTVLMNENFELFGAIEGNNDPESCLEIEIQRRNEALNYPVIEQPSSSREYFINEEGNTSHAMTLFFKAEDIQLSDSPTEPFKVIVCDVPFDQAQLENCQILSGDLDWVQTGADSFLVAETTLPEGDWYLTLAQGLITSFDEENITETVNVYPLPFGDAIYIETTQAFSSISILNVDAKTVFNQAISGERVKKLDTRSLPSGVYWLMLESESGTVIRKIIK